MRSTRRTASSETVKAGLVDLGALCHARLLRATARQLLQLCLGFSSTRQPRSNPRHFPHALPDARPILYRHLKMHLGAGENALGDVNGVQIETRIFLLLILLERETGIEPATFSLGKWMSIENKEHRRRRSGIQVY